jgi:hypothetical protein
MWYAKSRFVQGRLTPLDVQSGMDLTHLKRVRRSGKKSEDDVDVIDIILCAVSTLSEEELEKVVNEALEKGILISPRIERVSRWPAYNTRQLSEFVTLWPVTFRKDSTR